MSQSFLIFGGLGLVWLIGAALTYSKAEGEGRNGSLWGIAALIGGPIAWIAYAATGDKIPVTAHAPITAHDLADEHALHTGFSRAAVKADPDLAARADRSFSDPFIDRQIARGDLRGAKESVAAMIATGKEAHDVKMVADYEGYAQRIRHMELESVKRDAPTPVAGPPAEFSDTPVGIVGHAPHVDQALI